MKNYAMPLAIAIVGFGLMSIGFNLNGNTATATPAAFNAGPGEPTIVWYDSHTTDGWTQSTAPKGFLVLVRGWSDGTIEAKYLRVGVDSDACFGVLDVSGCVNTRGWFVISSQIGRAHV